MQDNQLMGRIDRRWRPYPFMSMWDGLRWRVVRALLKRHEIGIIFYAVGDAARSQPQDNEAEVNILRGQGKLYSLASWMLRTKPLPRIKKEKPRGPSAEEKATKRQTERVHSLLYASPEDAPEDGARSSARKLRLAEAFAGLVRRSPHHDRPD